MYLLPVPPPLPDFEALYPIIVSPSIRQIASTSYDTIATSLPPVPTKLAPQISWSLRRDRKIRLDLVRQPPLAPL